MTDYIDNLRSGAPSGVIVIAAKSRATHQDGLVSEYDTICCECGPHSLSFQPTNDLSEDAKIIKEWWESTAQFPLIM